MAVPSPFNVAQELQGRYNVLIISTGSVASIKIPMMVYELSKVSHCTLTLHHLTNLGSEARYPGSGNYKLTSLL